MATVKKNLKVDLLEYNEGQLSFIDEATNKQVGLPRNPRFIRDTRFEALKKSIEDAPEMLDLREILVYTLSGVKGKNGKYVVIGGNMRLRACKEIGYTEVPCKILDINTPMEKLREYAIKDNEAFGQNDFDILANEWDSDELLAWGMDSYEVLNIDSSIDDFFKAVAEKTQEQEEDENIIIQLIIPLSSAEIEPEIKEKLQELIQDYPAVKLS